MKRNTLFLMSFLVFVAFFSGLRLITGNYPTHSDVFYKGVECGVYLISLLVALIPLLVSCLKLCFHRSESNQSHSLGVIN